MIVDLHTGVYNLPGARQYVRLVGLDLVAGISTLLLIPDYISQSWIQQQLLDYLDVEHFILAHSLDLREYLNGEPVQVIASILSENGQQIKRLEQLVVNDNLPQVILLENLESLDQERVNEWLSTVARWAGACNASGSTHSLAVFASAQAASGWRLPPVDARLIYRLWTGIPSALEMRLLCRERIEEVNADAQWREHLLSSLAGNDPLLAEVLWDAILGSPEEIFDALKKFAHKQSWEKAEIERRLGHWRPKPSGVGLHLSPADPGFSLISEGYTIYTPEFGEEIHPVALILLGREEEVYHRIWRAQAALLLPWIDEVRCRICQSLTSTMGQGWAGTSPLELGRLKTYLDDLPTSSKDKQRWAKTAFLAWRIRNELAHYNPIPYSWYFDFWSIYCKVHAMIFSCT